MDSQKGCQVNYTVSVPLDPFFPLLIERGLMPLLVAVFTEQIGWKVGNSVDKLWIMLLEVLTPNCKNNREKRQVVVFESGDY